MKDHRRWAISVVVGVVVLVGSLWVVNLWWGSRTDESMVGTVEEVVDAAPSSWGEVSRSRSGSSGLVVWGPRRVHTVEFAGDADVDQMRSVLDVAGVDIEFCEDRSVLQCAGSLDGRRVNLRVESNHRVVLSVSERT